MKDVYKDVVDAVKAPDALVEKTLRLMLEEHKKIEAETQASADPEARSSAVAVQRDANLRPLSGQGRTYAPRRPTQAPPKKNRWVMQVALPVAACLALLLSAAVPRLLSREPDVYHAPGVVSFGPELVTSVPAEISHSPIPMTPAPEAHTAAGFTQSDVQALAADNLATRSGPAAEYRETGTYPVKGEHVRLISFAYDADGLCWVQCEVPYGGKLRRVYTGLQRLDAATFDLSSVPEEAPLNEQAKVIVSSKALYGPGDGYGEYAELTADEGQGVTILSIENAYAQVEWTTAQQSYRAWVPTDALGSILQEP